MNSTGKTKTSFKLAMLIVIVALLARFAYLFLFNGPMLSKDAGTDYIPLANNLAANMGYVKYGQPYLEREPMYSFFLSLFFRVVGENLLVIKIIQCLLGGVLCLIVYLIAKRLFDPPTALVSAAFAIGYPPFIYTNVDIATETLASLFLAGFILLWVMARENSIPKYWLITGVLLGMATLTRAATQFLPAVLLFFALGKLIKRETKPITLTLYLFFGFVVIVGGWTTRNYVVSKDIVIVSANGGRSMFHGSRPGFVLSGYEKYRGPQEEEKRLPLKGLTRAGADRLLQKAAIANLIELLTKNPFKFMGFMLRKFSRLWYATSSGYWEWHLLLLNGSLLLLAMVGVYCKLKAGQINSISPLIIIILYFAGLHTLAFPLTRYMVVVMPYVIILAASGLWNSFQYFQLVISNQ